MTAAPQRTPLAAHLPDFPWDTLATVRTIASHHPGGVVDLSVGTPVDPVPQHIQDALMSAAAEPGYPTTVGTRILRTTAAEAMTRRYGMVPLDPEHNIIPVVGTKEFIAGVARWLGLGADHTVVLPRIAYPTYRMGALLAGCQVILADRPEDCQGATPAVVFLNSPSNPTGAVLTVEDMRQWVQWAQQRNVILISDECYLGLDWSGTARSLLHPDVCGGNTTGLLALHSLSKTSNMASYRCGFVVGDAAIIAELLEVRKHAGLMVPTPVQAAAVAALSDDEHERQQYHRYQWRRQLLWEAVDNAGLTIDASAAGLYLWVTNHTHCRELATWCAHQGIVVSPGEFYGTQGMHHVRMSLTATDERIEAACQRLSSTA